MKEIFSSFNVEEMGKIDAAFTFISEICLTISDGNGVCYDTVNHKSSKGRFYKSSKGVMKFVSSGSVMFYGFKTGHVFSVSQFASERENGKHITIRIGTFNLCTSADIVQSSKEQKMANLSF